MIFRYSVARLIPSMAAARFFPSSVSPHSASARRIASVYAFRSTPTAGAAAGLIAASRILTGRLSKEM